MVSLTNFPPKSEHKKVSKVLSCHCLLSFRFLKKYWFFPIFVFPSCLKVGRELKRENTSRWPRKTKNILFKAVEGREKSTVKAWVIFLFSLLQSQQKVKRGKKFFRFLGTHTREIKLKSLARHSALEWVQLPKIELVASMSEKTLVLRHCAVEVNLLRQEIRSFVPETWERERFRSLWWWSHRLLFFFAFW